MKSEGVKDMVDWMEAKIKIQHVAVAAAERSRNAMGHFADCGDSYQEDYIEAKAKLYQMISWKISTEKYMKKLRHEEAEEL